MLSLLCLVSCLSSAEAKDNFTPVSAETAAYAAHLEMGESRIITQNRRDFIEVDVAVWYRDRLLEMPIARVNGVAITVGQGLMRWHSYIVKAAAHGGRQHDGEDLIQNILERELPSLIEQEVLYQLAERDFGKVRFRELLARCEFQFDNSRLKELMAELGPADLAAEALIQRHHATLRDIREKFIRQQMGMEYLAWRTLDSDDPATERKMIAAAEMRSAEIQTAFQLHPRK